MKTLDLTSCPRSAWARSGRPLRGNSADVNVSCTSRCCEDAERPSRAFPRGAWERGWTLVVTTVLLGFSASARAADEFDAAAAARVLAPFVERDTVAVVHIDFARVKVEPALALLARIIPDQKDDLARAESAANGFLDVARGAGVKDVYAVATLGGRSMIPQAFLVVPDSPQLNALVLSSLLNLGGQQGGAGSQGRKVGNAYVLPLTTHFPAVPEEFHPVPGLSCTKRWPRRAKPRCRSRLFRPIRRGA